MLWLVNLASTIYPWVYAEYWNLHHFSLAFREGIAKFATQLNVNIPGERNLLAAFTHESFLLQNADKITDFVGFNEKLAFLGKT